MENFKKIHEIVTKEDLPHMYFRTLMKGKFKRLTPIQRDEMKAYCNNEIEEYKQDIEKQNLIVNDDHHYDSQQQYNTIKAVEEAKKRIVNENVLIFELEFWDKTENYRSNSRCFIYDSLRFM